MGKCRWCDEGRPFLPGAEGLQHMPLFAGGEHSGTMCHNSPIYSPKCPICGSDPTLQQPDIRPCMSEWIKVEDQMPERADVEYWVWVQPNAGILCDGTLCKADFPPRLRTVKTYQSKHGGIRFNCGALEEVTHWQPMPPHPEAP